MRVMITGGHGFIGTHLCRELLAQGFEVLAPKRRAVSDAVSAAAPPVPTLDLLDDRATSRVVASFAPDVVVHLAAQITHAEEWQIIGMNAAGTANLLGACAGLKPSPPVVYTSSMSVYNYERPEYLPVDERHPVGATSAYGMSKYIGELLCQHYARSRSTVCAVLRLPGVYGPGRRSGFIYNLLASGLERKEVRVASLHTRRDFIYVKDVAHALSLAISKVQEGQSVLCNVSGGDVPDFSGLADLACAVAGHKPILCQNGSGATTDFWFDPSTAAAQLGFRARSVKDAMADFWGGLN